jgi:hypothetical protein
MVHDEMLTFSYQAKGDGTKDIVFYALDRDGHMVNAYEDGSKLHVDVCLYDGPCFDFSQLLRASLSPCRRRS